jgi:hypothetical protein
LFDLIEINWINAVVKKLEYGCNVEANALAIYKSLLRYEDKDYIPMQFRGKVYGVACHFTEYRIKAYNKTL